MSQTIWTKQKRAQNNKIQLTKQGVVLLALYFMYTFKLFFFEHCSPHDMHYKRKSCTVLLRRQNTRNKNPYLVYHWFRCGSEIFDTKTHNLADVLSFSSFMVNLLLQN